MSKIILISRVKEDQYRNHLDGLFILSKLDQLTQDLDTFKEEYGLTGLLRCISDNEERLEREGYV